MALRDRLPAPHPGCPLTVSQLRALELLAAGESVRAAAERLGVSESTLRSQRFAATRCLGAASAIQAVIICFNAGWLDPLSSDPDALRYAGPRVTWAQRLYLEAFDQHLRAWAAGDELGGVRTRRMMADALPGALGGRAMTGRPERRDPIERIARTLMARDSRRHGSHHPGGPSCPAGH